MTVDIFYIALLQVLLVLGLIYRWKNRYKQLYQITRKLELRQNLINRVLFDLPVSIVIINQRRCIEFASAEFIKQHAKNNTDLVDRHLYELSEKELSAILADRSDQKNNTNYKDITVKLANAEFSISTIKIDVGAAPNCESFFIHTLVSSQDKNKAKTQAEINQEIEVLFVQRYLSEVEQAKARIEEQAKLLEIQSKELAIARDTAQAATNAKASFLATMSHEIRTPMNGILGMAQLLADESLNEQQQEYVNIIKNAGSDLLTIINDILDSSKIDAGKLQLAPQDFDLPKLLSNIAALFELQMSAKGIVFAQYIDPKIPRGVHADQVRLRQVITNFLGNAMKFCPADGGILLAAFAEQVSETEVDFRLVVSDSGIGIPEDKQARIFQPFAQADHTVARDFGGTGLGLSICRKLLDLMGGEVGLKSRPGIGSSFYFRCKLPRAELSAVIDTASQNINASQKKELTILLVEDNPVNKKLAGKLLDKLGHRYQIASDGAEAVELFFKNRFDLVLMDCHLPILNGYDATREIRSKEIGANHVPIIALSASVMEDERQNCLDAGMDDFLAKPIDREALRKTLDKYSKC